MNNRLCVKMSNPICHGDAANDESTGDAHINVS